MKKVGIEYKPFSTKLIENEWYLGVVDKLFWIVKQVKNKEGIENVDDPQIRVRFEILEFASPTFVDWYIISNKIPTEYYEPANTRSRLSKSQKLFNALNIRNKDGQCIIRQKYQGSEFESQDDCTELLDMMKNKKINILTGKHVTTAKGDIYPTAQDLGIYKEQQ